MNRLALGPAAEPRSLLVYQVRTWDGQCVSNSKANLRYVAVTLPWLSILGQEVGPFRYEFPPALPSGQYRGKVCPNHEALRGLRYRSNAHCVGCHKDRLKRKRATPGHPVRENYLRYFRERMSPQQRERSRQSQREAQRRLRIKRKAAKAEGE